MSLNMSSKYIKMTALEGTFSPTQNIVSFSIPAGMKVDLSECAVLVDLSIISSDTNATASTVTTGQFSGGAGIYREHLVFDDAGEKSVILPNVAFVKNADMRCERVGQVESLRRVDTLRIAQNIYLKDVESKQGACYLNGVSNNGVGGVAGTPFRDMVRVGTIKSRNRPAQLRIPLRDIFDVANADVWDTTKYGRTDIKLEMNFDKLAVVQTLGRTDGTWGRASLGTYQAIDAPDGGGAGGKFTGNVDQKVFTTTKAYTHPEEQSPWHVGQKVVLNYTVTNSGTAVPFNFAAGNYRERTITQIDHNLNNDNKITLTFDVGVRFINNDVVSAVTFQGSDANPAVAPTIIFNKMEIEMKQVNGPTPPQIEYTTYSTEEDSGFAATQVNINKQYTMEGNADNVLICACGITNNIQEVVPKVHIEESRITIDNVEQTPERVINFTKTGIAQSAPLYYDRLDRFYMNNGEDLECLVEANLALEALESGPKGKLCSAYGETLPLKASPKQVQVDLTYAQGTIRHLQLYKRMIKSI